MRARTRRSGVRVLLMAALCVVVAGAFLLVGAAGASGTPRIVQVGDLAMSDAPQHIAPVWMGTAMLLAGLSIAVAGARQLD